MDCVFEIGRRQLYVTGARWSAATVPANFRPFMRPLSRLAAGASHLAVEVADCAPRMPQTAALSVSFNDLGRAAIHDGGTVWSIVLTPRPGEEPRVMEMDKDLRSATLRLRPSDRYADFVVDSMTRIFFSQAVALTGAIITHASVVGCGARAYMFMGRSGTGKSTHSRLWLDAFGDCTLINDDCPLVIPESDGGYTVCGTPWSGKTPCWRDESRRLAGIARLRQAPFNRFSPISGVDAFVAFIPGMSVMTCASALYSQASGTALALTSAVPVAMLDCLPDRGAALVCRRGFEAALLASRLFGVGLQTRRD